MGIVFTWLFGLLGVGRTVVLGLTALSFVVGVSGAYLKGRSDCAAIHETAALKAQVAEQNKTIADLKEAMEFGSTLAEAMEKAEKSNDEIQKSMPPVGSGDSCADAGFMRWLDKLR